MENEVFVENQGEITDNQELFEQDAEFSEKLEAGEKGSGSGLNKVSEEIHSKGKGSGSGFAGVSPLESAISNAISASKGNLLINIIYNTNGKISVNISDGKKTKTAGSYNKEKK